ncbi:calcium-binding protein [Alteromonas aestuariivivens]|uniref:Calcium-binding protein n=1 Tax=Alteromonas aestuariivivens TaxID=1938339 RepID=A0A3D8M6M6_9ALTE|nr:calcium-binding protein [Alteromonas aestuariivivens]RDV25281.1 calcium-binding protein [Alteromonas aestuariivivens]
MKRIEKLFLLLFTAAVIQTIVVANANAENKGPLDIISKLDVDQDGFISIKEAISDTELLRQFGKLDVNEDGKLSDREILASQFNGRGKILQS